MNTTKHYAYHRDEQGNQSFVELTRDGNTDLRIDFLNAYKWLGFTSEMYIVEDEESISDYTNDADIAKVSYDTTIKGKLQRLIELQENYDQAYLALMSGMADIDTTEAVEAEVLLDVLAGVSIIGSDIDEVVEGKQYTVDPCILDNEDGNNAYCFVGISEVVEPIFGA